MKKRAMAIPIVLILATVLGLISTFMLKSQQQYNKSNKTSFAQLQTYFVARAGVQHAMLKIKYLHRELYDAICLSQGRNPLFDFSLISPDDENTPYKAIKSYNPGPIFLYSSGYLGLTNNGVFTDNFETKVRNANLWLNAFMSDLNSNSADNPNQINGTTTNMTLDLNNMPTEIKSLMTKPFKNATYKVSKLNIAAQNNNDSAVKVENNAIVELVIDASVLVPKDSNPEHDEPFGYQIKKTVKISRD